MIIEEFPNLQWLQKQAEAAFADGKTPYGILPETPGWPNVVLNTATGRAYRPNIKGPLSLFFNLEGESRCKLHQRTVTIPQGSFFLTNPGEYYTLEVESERPVTTFNVHFGQGFTERSLASLLLPTDELLEQQAEATAVFDFSQQLYTAGPGFIQKVQALHTLHRKQQLSASQEEAYLYDLLELVLGQQGKIKKQVQRLSVTKSSTRKELYHRLSIARDNLMGNFRNPLNLEELAQSGHLSKFHFLRSFRQVFGITPHQFLLQLRLEEACRLLKTTREPITEIARLSGFEHSESFHRAFRKRYGSAPGAFRKAL
mgnify:CR=1 FL=1